MLNAIFVEMLIAAHRTRRTGVLSLDGLPMSRGLGFINGELVALELSQAQDRLLVDLLLDQHKIGPEMHRLVADAAAGSPLDFLRRQQAVNDSEIEAVRQILVEDALIQLLAGPGQPEFRDVHPEGLDYGNFAIRLRIDPQTLIRTAGSRVNEDAAVAQEVGGWDAVFALNESSAASGTLSDLDRQILNMVDGRRSIDEIGTLMRIGNQQISRALRGLLQKQVVRRIPGAGSRAFRASSAPLPANDVIIRSVSSGKKRSPVVLIGLVVLLLVFALVYKLVSDYSAQSKALAEKLDIVRNSIKISQWTSAVTALTEAKAMAVNDLSATGQVQTVNAELTTALANEATRIEGLMRDRDFTQVDIAIRRLPEGDKRNALQGQFANAEAEFRSLSNGITTQVTAQLGRDDLAGALAELRRQPSPEKNLAVQLVDRRRTALIQTARLANETLAKRRYYIDLVAGAEPNPEQLLALAEAEKELTQTTAQVSATLDGLTADLAAGRLTVVREALALNLLGNQVAGTVLARRIGELEAGISAVESALTTTREVIMSALGGDPAVSASVAAQRLANLSNKYPELPELTELKSMLQLTTELEATAAGLTFAEEIPWLRTRSKALGAPVELFEKRIARLQEIEHSAQMQLARVSSHIDEGSLEDAYALLRDLLDSPQVRRSNTHADAAQRLVEVQALQEKRRQQAIRLDNAIAKGDGALASSLAKEMGLKKMPVKLDSVPQGASVSIGPRFMGVTPLIVSLPPIERAEATFRFSQVGYESATAAGHDAENGWKISVELRRSPAAVLRLDRPMTAVPFIHEGNLVLASRSGYSVIGNVSGQFIAFRHGPLEQGGALDLAPLLAGPAEFDGALWFATPDAVAWRVERGGQRRVVLPVGTHLPLRSGTSEFLEGRRWLVICAQDGRLVGCDPQGRQVWETAPGAMPVAAPQVLSGGRVVVIRKDGVGEALNVEDGRVVQSVRLPEGLIAAWPLSGTAGWRGISANQAWTWSGDGPVERSPLPVADPIAAAPGVIISLGNRVFWEQPSGWISCGALPSNPTGPAIAWAGGVAVPVAAGIAVFGQRAFVHRTTQTLLPPISLGNRLVIIDQAGLVTFYEP